MDVTVQAFEITLSKGITANDFYDHLQASAVTPFHERYLYLTRDGDLWKGVLLTARNIKAFSRMIKDGNRIQLSPEQVQNGELAHFNFFIINQTTGRGLFQYYHGAASVHGFASVLKFRCHELKEKMIAAACRESGIDLENPPPSILSRYSGNFRYEIILRKKQFAQLISEMKKIRQVKIQFAKYVPSKKLFRALASQANTVRHTLSFRNQFDGSLRNNLVALINAGGIKNMSGVGEDDNDIEQHFKLINEPETLATYDFNAIVSGTAFDSNDVHNSLQNVPLIHRLVGIAATDTWMTPTP